MHTRRVEGLTKFFSIDNLTRCRQFGKKSYIIIQIFFSVWEGKKIFCKNLQTFSFVHTRRVDGSTKYDFIGNIVFLRDAWKRGKNLKSFTTSIFSGWGGKTKTNFLHFVHGKATKTQKNNNFYHSVHSKAPKTQKNTTFLHYVNAIANKTQKKTNFHHYIHWKAPKHRKIQTFITLYIEKLSKDCKTHFFLDGEDFEKFIFQELSNFFHSCTREELMD